MLSMMSEDGEMRYRSLTLTPPWGTLIAIGAKQIETRSWPTSHRGPLLIHQGSNLKPIGGMAGLRDIVGREPFSEALFTGEMDFADWPKLLPMGKIVAACELVGCVRIAQARQTHTIDLRTFIVPPYSDLPEYAFGDYAPGRYAWLLADVRALPEPIAVRGMPGLWQWEGEIPV